MNALIFVVQFGFDSLLAGAAIGSCGLSWRDRLRLALAFGVCDMAATLAGSLWSHRLPELPILTVYLSCAFVFAWALRGNRALLYVLPVLLGVDNFLAGNPAGMAPVLGFGSAAMALAGLSLVVAVQRAFFAAPAEA